MALHNPEKGKSMPRVSDERPKEPKKPVSKLTLFLLKTTAPKDEECLTDKPFKSIQVHKRGIKGTIYIFRSAIKKPLWLKLIEPLLDEETGRAFISSGRLSALFFLTVPVGNATQRFVLALGHGAHRLDDSTYETDFGRDACLSLADTTKMNSIDEQQFKDQGLKVRTQATNSLGAASFAIDPYSIVTRITADAKDADYGKRLTGSESFVTNARVVADDLPSYCEKVFRSYRKRLDRVAFEWANRVTRITDSEIITSLDQKLISLMKEDRAAATESIFFTAPRVVDWDDTEQYVITGTGEKQAYDDFPELSSFLGSVDLDDLDLEYLRKGCRLHVFDGDDRRYSWSLYRCLSAEVHEGQKIYVLSNGNWHHVHKDFLKRVNGKVEDIPQFCPYNDGKAPKTNRVAFEYGRNTKEEAFNQRAAAALKAALYDRKLHNYSYISKGSTVEPCDIFTRQGHFIHVKRYKGSAPLSHLFFQGIVASECLQGDPNFRKSMCEKAGDCESWVSRLLLNEKFQAQDITTVFGIAAGAAEKMTMDKLPIFSRISLAQTADGFRGLGMPLQVWLI